MIKINLLGDDSAVDNSGRLMLMAYAASVVVFFVICAVLNSSAGGEIQALNQQVEELDGKLARLKVVTAEVKDLEKKRKGLNDKLVVIALLKKNKRGPVRVLDDLNSALPERSWLLDAKESGNSIRLTGMALDNETIATLMKQLESSDYFDGVELVESRQATREGARIRAFAINSRVNYAGKIAVDEPASSAPSASPEVPVQGGKS